MNNERKCLLKMTHDSLMVANTGQPFSRLGVISICASYRGTKKQVQPIDLFSEWKDADLSTGIREKEIDTYLRDENRLLDDYNQEREVSFDYGGRFLWELLQNADDAMCPDDNATSDLIGIKGLGFKSVLEITDTPEVYSEPFHFYFSAIETQRILKSRGIGNPPRLTFRIPHDKQDFEEIKDLLDEYPTIIRLPYKDKLAKKMVESKLNNLSLFFLLLSQYIKVVEVVWEDGRTRKWRIDRDDDREIKDGDILVEFIENDIVQNTHRFRRWVDIWKSEGADKRHSFACCLPLNSKDDVQAWETTFPLYCFFPTEEFLPFHALFHASFDLDQSRKHVRHPASEDIFSHFEILLGRIVASVPTKISLDAFFPKDQPIKETIAHSLWKRIETVLRKSNFVSCIGGNKVAPSEGVLWGYDIGSVLRPDRIKRRNLIDLEILGDESHKKALEYLGAHTLENEQYLCLLKYCKNGNRDECQRTLGVFFRIIHELIKYFPFRKDEYYLKVCREIPCWWTTDSIPLSLSGKCPLLRTRPNLSIPFWLKFYTLDGKYFEFLNEIESSKKNDSQKIWEEILYGRLLHDKKNDLLDHLFIPEIELRKEIGWWEQHGDEALHLYQLWTKDAKFDGRPVSIWNDGNRERLGKALFLPTDKGWIPAWQCYAGKSWGASESIDVFFKNIADRGVLVDPSQWPVPVEDINIWKRILRYAGVSWEVKLIRKLLSDNGGWEIQGCPGSWRIESPFESLIQEEDWSNYLRSLSPPSFNRRTEFDWYSRVHEQWAIEFFPDALPQNPLEVLLSIQPVAKEAKGSRMKYSFQKGGGWEGRNSGQLKSFAAWQIEDFPWMPCKSSIFDNRLEKVPIDKAYMPGKGIGGLLPEINIRLPEGQTGRDLETFLTQVLGVRETLPLPGEIIWKEWIEKLPQALQRKIDQPLAIRATRMLYKCFFDTHDEKPEWFDGISNLPYLRWDKEGKSEQLNFAGTSDIYWLDETYLAEPTTRIELLRRFNILVLEQEHGEKAASWYDIKPLSSIVHVEPNYYIQDEDTTRIIQERYAERYKSLKVVSGLANLPKPEDLKILAVDNLRLKILLRQLNI